MKNLLQNFFEELGLFIDLECQIEPNADVKKNEKIIGEMNDMEKKLYTFIQMKQNEYDDLVKKMESADNAGNYETLGKLTREHSKKQLVGKLASTILWNSIELRFENSKGVTRVGVRKGFKIVEIFEDGKPSVSSMVIPGLGVMISIRG